MKPFLSIIIPVYKVEPYLRECLDSIAVPELNCWEAILIDDGSPDGCPQICDEYSQKDRRFRVIHQQNAGVAAARNAGLDIAQGEWVWFVDSDDMVDMAYVGEIVEWLKAHKNVDLVMFDLDSFNEYETLSLRNAVATKRCRYENIACGEGFNSSRSSRRNNVDVNVNENENQNENEKNNVNNAFGEEFKGSSSSKGSKNVNVNDNVNVNVNQESVIENQPSAIRHQTSAVNVNQETVSVERLAVSESQPSSVIEHSTLNTQHSTLNVTVPNTKNEFLTQYISFFHQQYWFRRSEKFRFTKGVQVSEDLELMYKYFTLCRQPVKFLATLYHYRVRESSVTQDENYRRKVVEDLPIVLKNLAEWVREYEIRNEPWLDLRIVKLFQNFLYSASLINKNEDNLSFMFDAGAFQIEVRSIIKKYCDLGFPFVTKMKYRLAKWNVRAYFILNKLFLKLICAK